MSKSIWFAKRAAAGLAVFAVSAGAFAADDPTTAVTSKLTEAGGYAATVGGAVLALVAAIAAFKFIRRAI